MSRKLKGEDVLRRVGELAFGRSNDAVKLAFLDPENVGLIDGLDLGMVSEVKRSSNGSVEIKLLNRIALLELLSGLLIPASDPGDKAESFFSAMDRAAVRIGDAEK